jgi:fibronectin-binding autotransporter adhesin
VGLGRRAALFTCIAGAVCICAPGAHALIPPDGGGGSPFFVQYVGPQFGGWSTASSWLNQSNQAQTPFSGDDIYLGLSGGITTTDDIAGGLTTNFLDFISGSNFLTVASGSSLNISQNGVKVGAGASATIEANGAGAAINLFNLTDPNSGREDIALANGGTFSIAIGITGATIGSLQSDATGTTNLGGNQLTVGTTNQFSAYSGTIQGSGGSLKVAGGTLSLSNANTYTGGTTVNGGTLYVTNSSGSATGTGNVTVNSGATIGGSGAIAGNLTVNSGATLTPGVFNTRTLGVGGSLTLGGTLAIQLGGTNPGGVISGYDQVKAAGITLSGATLSLSLAFGFTPTAGQMFFILDNTSSDPLTPTSGLFSNGATVTDNAGNLYSIGYTGADPGNSSGLPGRDIVLTALVPEPSSYLLLLSAAAGAFLFRCFRRKAT